VSCAPSFRGRDLLRHKKPLIDPGSPPEGGSCDDWVGVGGQTVPPFTWDPERNSLARLEARGGDAPCRSDGVMSIDEVSLAVESRSGPLTLNPQP
jgi:hypothetical protein